MSERPNASLEDANAIVSDLAYWIARSDNGAALVMMEGFGAALSSSAAMRARGLDAAAIALALAEEAERLKQLKDARHAGWLLLSIWVELVQMTASNKGADALAPRGADLSDEVSELASLLVRRGTEALAA